MIAVCTVSMSASCAYIFRNAFDQTKRPSVAKHSGIGEYCYIDYVDIVHIDRLCKKLNKGFVNRRVEPTKLYGHHIEGYCPMCVDDEDYEALKAISKQQKSLK